MIVVRRVGPEDWQVWRGLRRAALAEAPGAFSATLAAWSGAGDTEQRWRDRLRDVPLNLVLTTDGEPIGMVSATRPGPDGAVELISLWVHPEARGHGAGDEGVRQVASWAGAEHPGSPLLLSVKTDNTGARRLYERHGFVDAGPAPGDPTERLMRRPAPTPGPGGRS
ncbi:GNAT family N-acetyltransferase [Geodermatophilus sp. DSM 44513]|uniref:GNAT family N-acetyltransferase n=1 Tax=Geodermatophilus sp. DSM 44513 TaxID=1528104 RepID=UPI001412D930|nr:GNAT family N-acetyltransferase [Geodermatophilus sp. DSM 44513]WNV76832.1 GNAT family N-acetyltransferase [Geodermatophilus sp. DSM 44513]